MIKVMIANNITTYMMGQSDGLTFKNVTDKDLQSLQSLANKYAKQIKIFELPDIDFIKEESSTNDNIIQDKRKIKKVFITNGKELIKITPDKLPEYIAKGYHQGRK